MKKRAPSVFWCMNNRCKLYGLPNDEQDICSICDQPLTRLTWAVIVCEPRGVYMGLVEMPSVMPAEIRAFQVRNAVFYKQTGDLGLAVVGPMKGSRITGAAEEMLLKAPKTIAVCSEKALQAWEDEPWTS